MQKILTDAKLHIMVNGGQLLVCQTLTGQKYYCTINTYQNPQYRYDKVLYTLTDCGGYYRGCVYIYNLKTQQGYYNGYTKIRQQAQRAEHRPKC